MCFTLNFYTLKLFFTQTAAEFQWNCLSLSCGLDFEPLFWSLRVCARTSSVWKSFLKIRSQNCTYQSIPLSSCMCLFTCLFACAWVCPLAWWCLFLCTICSMCACISFDVCVEKCSSEICLGSSVVFLRPNFLLPVFWSRSDWTSHYHLTHRPQHNLFPPKFTGSDISFAHGVYRTCSWCVHDLVCVCVLLMHWDNDSQLLCLNREHIWRKGRGKDSKKKQRKEENMLAYHKVNVISCLFVLQYSISDSGAALENIWKTVSLPCICRQSYLCILLQIAWTCLCDLCNCMHYACFAFMLLWSYSRVFFVHVCMWSELSRSLCVFRGTVREKVAAMSGELSCLWFWNWLYRNPPRLKRSFSPCERNKEKKLKSARARERVCVCEKEGEQRERERQRLVYSYLGGRSFLLYESHF